MQFSKNTSSDKTNIITRITNNFTLQNADNILSIDLENSDNTLSQEYLKDKIIIKKVKIINK